MPRQRFRGYNASRNGLYFEDEYSDDSYAAFPKPGARHRYRSPSVDDEGGQDKESQPQQVQAAPSNIEDKDREAPCGKEPQGAGTGSGTGTADVKPAPVRPTGWERRVDLTGRTYWVNHDTRATTWDAPELSALPVDERERQEEADRRAEVGPLHAARDHLGDRSGVKATSDNAEHNAVPESQKSPTSDVEKIQTQGTSVAGGMPERVCKKPKSLAEVGESEDEDKEASPHTPIQEPVPAGSLDPLESHDDPKSSRSSSLSSMKDLPGAAIQTTDTDDDIQAAIEASKRYLEVQDAKAFERARAESLEAAEQAERKRAELVAELWRKEELEHQQAIKRSLKHAKLEAARKQREEQQKQTKIVQAIAENARLAAVHQHELEVKRGEEEREHDALIAVNRRLKEENDRKLEQRRAEEALQYGYMPGETEEELLERVIRASLEEDMRRAAGLEAERKRLVQVFGSGTTQQRSAPPVSQFQPPRMQTSRSPYQEPTVIQTVTEGGLVSTSGLSPLSAAPPTAGRAPTVIHNPTTRRRSDRRTEEERRRPHPTEVYTASVRKAVPIARPSSMQASLVTRELSIDKPLPKIPSSAQSRSQPSAVRAEVEQAASAVQSLPLHRLSSLALNPATEASSATRSTARRSIDFYPAPSPRSSQPASQLTLESSSEDPHVARAPEANTPAAPARASELTADEQARDEAMLREVLRLSAGEVVKDPEDGIDDPPPSYEEAIAAPPASAPAA